jgi:23S rRNA (pseudouridine1915-N3)-methyltransferase
VKLLIVAVGQRLPGWAQQACEEFCKRFSGDVRLDIKAVKAESRDGKAVPALLDAERERIEAAIKASCGRHPHRIALDERGLALGTHDLANRLRQWQGQGGDVALLIGGPDGLDPALKASAHECIRLSDLTLPHALARVLLVEQLYRAWTINQHHPYHRE